MRRIAEDPMAEVYGFEVLREHEVDEGTEDAIRNGGVMDCRCGAKKDDTPHPCHGEAYTCRKPAERRWYNARPVALSGMQMKVQVEDTWACEECWSKFKSVGKERK